MSLNFQSKKAGFTLAELLVVLGIIGVVAALTVPNLISSTGSKKYAAALQKAYTDLSNAIVSVQTQTPQLTIGTGTTTNHYNQMMNEFSNVLDFAETGAPATMWTHNVFRFKDNISGPFTPTSGNMFSAAAVAGGLNAGRLASGAVVVFDTLANCGNQGISACGSVTIDTNGKTQPNMFGYDVHRFYVVRPAGEDFMLVPAGVTGDTGGTGCAAGNAYQWACTANVINNPALL